jgi:hypothetical protein
LDDYDWRQHDEQKAAWDRSAANGSLRILSLPTGPGLIMTL